MATKTKGKARKQTRKTSDRRKRKSLKDYRIAVLGKTNPRREGTRAHKSVASMLKVTANGKKKVPVTDVMAKTKPQYRHNDVAWDVEHGFIKLVPLTGRAA
jgi:hypothetical protein